MKRFAVIVVLAGLAVWPAAPAADQTTSAGLIQSTEVVGERQGVEITHTVRRVDGQLPPPLTELELKFPPGTRLNTAAFPRCSLAVLQAKGPSGCVPRSTVGSGIVRAQVPFRFPHEFAGTLTIFNGPKARHSSRRLLMYIRPQAGPSWVLAGRWAGSRRAGLRLILSLSRITIPEIELDSLVRLELRIGARRRGTSFLRAPCPGTHEATAQYYDGSVVTSSDRARCG